MHVKVVLLLLAPCIFCTKFHFLQFIHCYRNCAKANPLNRLPETLISSCIHAYWIATSYWRLKLIPAKKVVSPQKPLKTQCPAHPLAHMWRYPGTRPGRKSTFGCHTCTLDVFIFNNIPVCLLCRLLFPVFLLSNLLLWYDVFQHERDITESDCGSGEGDD